MLTGLGENRSIKEYFSGVEAMKKSLAAFFAMLICMSAPAFADNWFVLTISGSWQDSKVGFISKPFRYPGYRECNKVKDTEFTEMAKRAFWTHIEANHPGNFPHTNVPNNIRIHGQFDDWKTGDIAQQKAMVWVASEKNSGQTVVYTNFTYACK
jgi:hypothetical protein